MADGLFPLGESETPSRKLTDDEVSVEKFRGEEVLVVEPVGLRLLAEAARQFRDNGASAFGTGVGF